MPFSRYVLVGTLRRHPTLEWSFCVVSHNFLAFFQLDYGSCFMAFIWFFGHFGHFWSFWSFQRALRYIVPLFQHRTPDTLLRQRVKSWFQIPSKQNIASTFCTIPTWPFLLLYAGIQIFVACLCRLHSRCSGIVTCDVVPPVRSLRTFENGWVMLVISTVIWVISVTPLPPLIFVHPFQNVVLSLCPRGHFPASSHARMVILCCVTQFFCIFLIALRQLLYGFHLVLRSFWSFLVILVISTCFTLHRTSVPASYTWHAAPAACKVLIPNT